MPKTELQKSPNTRIIRKPELAQRLGVSKRTLLRMEKEGILPQRVKVSKRIVGWRSDEIDEFLENRPRQQPKEPA